MHGYKKAIKGKASGYSVFSFKVDTHEKTCPCSLKGTGFEDLLQGKCDVHCLCYLLVSPTNSSHEATNTIGANQFGKTHRD